MARKKTTKPVVPSSDENSEIIEAAKVESPISTTGASPVFRADLGEALPPQDSILNPDRAK